MQNLKYHTLNTLSIMVFSLLFATTVNQVIKYNISPTYTKSLLSARKPNMAIARKSFEDYNSIIESGFFKIAGPEDSMAEGPGSAGSISELTLLGTITGPTSIARAMIIKTGEKNPGIFALFKVNSEISNDVYGNRLVWIADSKVYLDVGGQRVTLDLYAKQAIAPANPNTGGQSTVPGNFSQTLSRAEIRQKVFNNMDNALRGLQAGPYRINGQIVGYRLINVRPYNVLYKLGARSGDVIRRINGQQLDSTQKLMATWEAVKNDPKITIDIERGGKPVRYDFNITD
ncbi:MAG: hypothetical protein E4G96_05795 [Chrysiogenales bacterium]|nr:MAG: hypothetical protein E4G96_05795 [Chrysiogenales bacterium]